MSLARSFINSLGVFKFASVSVATLGLFACGGGSGGDDPISRGKDLYAEQNCASCHANGEKNNGFKGFEAHKIYSEINLAGYISDNMPTSDPGLCVGECASDIAAYIASYHDFPSDPGTSNNIPADTPFACTQNRSFGNRALRPLTRAQYQKTVEDLLAVDFSLTSILPPDDKSGSFYNNTNVSILSNSYTSYIQAAEEIAAWMGKRNFRSASTNCNSFNSQCYNDIIDNFAPKLFRRPLTSEEKSTFQGIASGASTEGDIKAGIELALAVMLSSPQFIYRHEIGEANNAIGSGAYELTDYEMATFLSYTFAGTSPDQTLLTAAKDGKLSTDSQIQAQAKRLLDQSSADELMGELVHLWLGTDILDKFVKSPENIANYSDLIPDLEKELSLNFSEAMLDSNGSFGSLYTPGYTFVNQKLANHYGMSGVGGSQFQKVSTDERGGILLSGAFLSLHGDSKDASPIRRAVNLRRQMLCQDVPAPPAGVQTGRDSANAKHAAELALSTTTNRRRYELITSEKVCANCHEEVINPLGFGLEDYDTVGRFRSSDLKGNSIDASGEMFSPYQALQFLDTPDRNTNSVGFHGGQGLAEVMTDLPQAKSCLAQQIMSYSTGLDVLSLNNSDRRGVLVLNPDERHGYGCVVDDMKGVLTSESPRAMLEKLGSMDTIRYRKAWTR